MLRVGSLFALLLLIEQGAASGVETWSSPGRKPLDIVVRDREFGRVSSADIAAVLQSAALELRRHCPHTQIPGIDVCHRDDHPQMDSELMANGRLRIGLTARDTRWAQFSFQFAHEFCHTLANYSNGGRPSVRRPHHANLWLEESLCETASLYVLRAMGRTWLTSPPHPAWRSYAPWLSAYAGQRLALPQHRLPGETPFIVWFRNHQPALRRNATLREWNTTIAIELLPILEAEPRGWGTLKFLNGGSGSADASLAQHLSAWRSRCPRDLRQFVTKLAAVFEVIGK